MEKEESQKDGVTFFESVVVIDFSSESNAGVLSQFFPDELSKSLVKSIPRFCFPESEVINSRDQFSFILTSENGERIYGYTLRGPLDKGSSRAFCALSKLPVSGIMSQILHVAETRYNKAGWQSTVQFLEVLSTQKMPQAGQSITIDCVGINNERLERYKFTRPEDSERYLDSINFSQVLLAIPSENLASIFSSLLYERRILFCSKNISLLSNCVQTCITILYPFNWQYVLVPVLPHDMIDVVCAPVPFVVGISSRDLPKVQAMGNALEEIVVYDLDLKTFLKNPHKDELKIPQDSIRHLVDSLTHHSPHEHVLWKIVSGDQGSLNPRNLNVKIADVFLGFLLQYLRNYDSCIVGHTAFGFHFSKDLFLKMFPPNALKFMEEFVQTQLFQCFIFEREQYPDHYRGTTFEQKLHMLSQLLKAKSKKGTSSKDISLLQTAIDEIFGIVPSKFVFFTKMWGDN